MDEFRFEGRIPASKSMLNRALVLRSYAKKSLHLIGESDADDVIFLRKALGKIEDGRDFYLGEGGTTLRFFAVRASREKGQYGLKVAERLFRRPQAALQQILAPLGVEFTTEETTFKLKSNGWKNPGQPLQVPTGESSQFASALVLNAWNLNFPLELEFTGPLRSEGYLAMTLTLCRQAGMEIEVTSSGLRIPPHQKIQISELRVEPDYSSMFSIAANAALNGKARIEELPKNPLQPDHRFSEFLSQMGVPVSLSADGVMEISKAPRLKALIASMDQTPDLVPVLSVLCAFAEGKSVLSGAPHLRHKESDRIRSTAKLLRLMGVDVTERDDGLEIIGNPDLVSRAFDFDPDQDHRLAMAAGLLVSRGWPVRVLHPDVVTKSFPEFWRLLRAGPHLLIGHRGVGKTQLLSRFPAKGAKIDLDAEIEKRTGQKIFDFFRDRGEEIFRQTEVAVLNDLLKSASSQDVIALGAGVRLDEVHNFGEKIWVRRDSDHEGRVFLDRPRLDPGADPLVEFRERAKLRERSYERYCDRIYTLPEGLQTFDEIEEQILTSSWGQAGGGITLFPGHRKTIPQLGADFYELRDDLLDPDEVRSLLAKLDSKKVVYSIRKNRQIPEEILRSNCRMDWALDSFYPEKEFVQEHADRLILSSHGTMSDAFLDFRIYSKAKVHLKLAPLVESFEELKEGHAWWAQDPDNRSFLPRSAGGRWGWYRLWMKGRMKLNFWREGLGSSLDQPTLWQWLATPARPEVFAAVLGHPVLHSWTPTEHRRFFAEIQAPVWAIEVREEEWNQAFAFLTDLGLRYAAVTSPLKGLAARHSEMRPQAQMLGSVNTLLFDRQSSRWVGDNTDLDGLRAAVRGLPAGEIAVWGGGGTLGVLKEVLPQASAFSATAGHLRQGSAPLKGSPTVVVWAAPRGNALKMPPEDWKPKVVLDLNYKEDSPGREYALRCQAEYRSGEIMFRAQAAAQRAFWQDDVNSRGGER